jgi:hypothetical protein
VLPWQDHVPGAASPETGEALLQVAVTNHVGDEETHLLLALQKKATSSMPRDAPTSSTHVYVAYRQLL